MQNIKSNVRNNKFFLACTRETLNVVKLVIFATQLCILACITKCTYTYAPPNNGSILTAFEFNN